MSEESLPENGVAQFKVYRYQYDAAGHLDGVLVEPAPNGGVTPERGICGDCKGTGKISLLISVRPCETCGGSGRVPASCTSAEVPEHSYSVVELDSSQSAARAEVERHQCAHYHYDYRNRTPARGDDSGSGGCGTVQPEITTD